MGKDKLDPKQNAEIFLKKKKLESRYKLVKFLDGGGNADVCIVENSKSQEIAFKYLRGGDKTQKERFCNEIDILDDIAKQGIKGVMPVFESSKNDFWYTMPIAQKIEDYLMDKSFIDTINVGISLAKTLNQLHEKGVSHRDIKPDNIYYYNNGVVLGDFGLASFPDKPQLTNSTRRVGAIFTIAPEMLRYPDTADGRKADVYSLAKTLWILLSDEKKGFDGSYDYLNNESSLRNHLKYKEKKTIHLVELEQLLKKATEYDPDKRPSMKEFGESLDEYVRILSIRDQKEESDWNFLGEMLFNQIVPQSVLWKDVNTIDRVLNTVGMSPVITQMINANGNTIPIDQVGLSVDNKLSLSTQDTTINVNPFSLRFERFNDFRLNYFLLEIQKDDYSIDIGNPLIFVLKIGPFNGFFSENKNIPSAEFPQKFLDYVKKVDEMGRKQ